jgi:predicted amidophosphoribosyltransferase
MSLIELAREAWVGALDLVFAPVCVGCKRQIATDDRERIVCRVCWARCRPVPAPRCPRCWGALPTQVIGRRPRVVGGDGGSGVQTDGSADSPSVDDSTESADSSRAAEVPRPSPKCRACAEWPAAVRVVRAAFVMGDGVRSLVHALKYRGWEAAAGPMAARMAALPWPQDVLDEARVVAAVPTTKARLRERGYNQAALLARELAARTGRAFDPDYLVRTRESGSQTSLRPGERRANVAGAFAVPEGRGSGLRGEHVVLVDDVWTTGATALACAGALLDAGARVVSVATFARVFPGLDR